MISEILSTELGSSEAVQRALNAIRKHLGMEVAYISEFVGDRSVFRVVDAPGLEALIKPGDSRALDDVYCRHIMAGRLPELMADTANYSLAQSMPITHAVPIGAHMSVPLRSPDGTALGMFCCLSPHANTSLNERDLQMMRVFADMTASEMARQKTKEAEHQKQCKSIEHVIQTNAFTFLFQPICDIRTLAPRGFEALCRFTGEPYRSPDKWFSAAFDVNAGVELELAVLNKAVLAFDELPADIYLSFNASPATIVSGQLDTVFGNAPLRRVVLEITEHAPVDDYDALSEALVSLRQQGVRLAIDDAGAGYAGLQHMVHLRPDIIKLDISLTRAVDVDPARRALASALIFFARETGCDLIAEGIETSAELETLDLLCVPRGQGYFLGRPVDLAAAKLLAGTGSQRRTG